MTDQEIQKLREIALTVEERFQKGPQDIEWAIAEDGTIYLLQAKPLVNIK